jgi:hypothetical protein
VRKPQSYPEDTETGALYFIINQDESQTDCGGSYLPFNRYSACTTQTSAPWVWERCDHGKKRLIGGLHFLNFAFNVNTEPTRVYVAIAWGICQDDSDAVNLVAKISRTRGLGRTLFELTVDIKAERVA